MHRNPFGVKEYRADVDGLRAIAVISVVINHFSERLLPGGYLGVDVFFVISGYVITSSLSSLDKDSPVLFLGQFYARRIRRILPALITFVSIMAVFVCIVSPFTDLYLKTGAFSLFGFSNVYLYKQATGYWESFSKLNPYLHTWSLGVEEQFYLIFPALAWICGYQRSASKKYITVTLTALCVISYAIFFHTSLIAPDFAQYMLPARFWELSLGCLAFLYLREKLSKCNPICSNKAILVAMIFILMLFVLPRQYDLFSKSSVVVLATYLISAIQPKGVAFRVLASDFMVAIGLRSYSLYLWHWGVLAIARLTVGISFMSVPALILIMAIVTHFSYDYVEKPFRLKPKSHVYPALLKALSVCGLMSFYVLAIGRLGLYKGDQVFDPVTKSEVRNDKNCNIFNVSNEAFRECIVANNKATRTLYLVGDSHSFQFAQAMKDLSRKYDLSYANIWGTGCPFPASDGEYPNAQCASKQDDVGQFLMQNVKRNDIVVIANTLSLSVSKRLVTEGADKRYKRNRAFAKKLESYMAVLRSKGALLVLYINPPYFSAMNYPGWACQKAWFRSQHVLNQCPKVRLSSHLTEMRNDFPELRTWENDKSLIVWHPSLRQLGCKDDLCDSSIYMDSNHYSLAYAYRELSKFLRDQKSALSL